MKRQMIRRVLALAAALAVAGCAADPGDDPAPETAVTEEAADGADQQDGDTDDPTDATDPDTADDAVEVPAVYDFRSTTRDGEVFDGASLVGQPAVLWFWAPWCPTCIGQIPTVTALAEEHGDEVAIVAVGGLDDAEAIIALADESIPHVLHLVDDAGEVWKHFGMTQQSTFVVLDADGEILAEGRVTEEALEDLVEHLAG